MNILETLQKIATTTERLDMALAEVARERTERQRFEDAIVARIERVEAHLFRNAGTPCAVGDSS